eukprot:SAG31_NODE_34594_length_331_cov_0.991379_1_plen_76_part_10
MAREAKNVCKDADHFCLVSTDGWTKSSLNQFVVAAAAAGIRSLTIYRQDLKPAAGTQTKIPPWFLDICASFLAGNT